MTCPISSRPSGSVPSSCPPTHCCQPRYGVLSLSGSLPAQGFKERGLHDPKVLSTWEKGNRVITSWNSYVVTPAVRRCSWFKKPHLIFVLLGRTLTTAISPQFTVQWQHLNYVWFFPEAFPPLIVLLFQLPLLTLPAPLGITSPAEIMPSDVCLCGQMPGTLCE